MQLQEIRRPLTQVFVDADEHHVVPAGQQAAIAELAGNSRTRNPDVVAELGYDGNDAARLQ